MASIDVAKAFPLVFHPALIATMRSLGVPYQFLRYVDCVCKRINVSTFVDDVNLYVKYQEGCKLFDKMVNFLIQCDMSINIDKSFTLGFGPSPRDKISTIDVDSKLIVETGNLRSMTGK